MKTAEKSVSNSFWVRAAPESWSNYTTSEDYKCDPRALSSALRKFKFIILKLKFVFFLQFFKFTLISLVGGHWTQKKVRKHFSSMHMLFLLWCPRKRGLERGKMASALRQRWGANFCLIWAHTNKTCCLFPLPQPLFLEHRKGYLCHSLTSHMVMSKICRLAGRWEKRKAYAYNCLSKHSGTGLNFQKWISFFQVVIADLTR